MSSVVVGFSVNPEISYEYAEMPGEKGALNSFNVSLSGTSVNVASALKSLGHNSLLMVPSEGQESDAGYIFERVLRRSELTHVRLNVLDSTPLAVYPVNGDRKGQCLLYGRKGVLTKDPSRIERAIKEVCSFNGLWRIATGVDIGMTTLAWNLLGDEKNFRVLSPHWTLCKNSDFRNFTLAGSPLERCDVLVLNKLEFEEFLQRSEEDLHAFGVRLIIVTEGESGGRFSLCNDATGGVVRFGKYEAVHSTTRTFSVGAGDWFLGGFVSRLMEAEEGGLATSFASMPFEVVQDACSFGAKVAGVKVTMKGGSNGPTRSQVAC